MVASPVPGDWTARWTASRAALESNPVRGWRSLGILHLLGMALLLRATPIFFIVE
jgi:hypothetical protein